MVQLNGARKLSCDGSQSPQIVRCDICGGTYNRSYLTSHKRLAHKKRSSATPVVAGAEGMERILEIYGQLSREDKKLALNRLSASLDG